MKRPSTEPAEGGLVANDAAINGARPGRGRSRFAPLVLCYHAVSATWEHRLSVPPEALHNQLTRLIKSGYKPATVADAARGGGELLHVTFDDAYKSVLFAMPIFEELGIHATVFACSSFADSGATVAVPELRQEVARNPKELETLTWDELRELSERGVEIGSHTVTHPHLTATTDAELDWELVESKHRIEDEIGRPCRFLAYPYGEHDLRVREAAQAAGYEGAFALPMGTEWGDPFQISRIGIYRFDSFLWIGIKTSRFFRGRLGTKLVRPRTERRAAAARRRDDVVTDSPPSP
jgi:peptidoglycan/xylan/chitin deacetylase (PgdA/CDA1 family)